MALEKGVMTIKQLPTLSHLQFLVLSCLDLEQETSGYQLRAMIRTNGWTGSLAAFYQLMKRLETIGLVSGRYQLLDEPGSRERCYRLLPAGQQEMQSVLQFYQELTQELSATD